MFTFITHIFNNMFRHIYKLFTTFTLSFGFTFGFILMAMALGMALVALVLGLQFLHTLTNVFWMGHVMGSFGMSFGLMTAMRFPTMILFRFIVMGLAFWLLSTMMRLGFASVWVLAPCGFMGFRLGLVATFRLVWLCGGLALWFPMSLRFMGLGRWFLWLACGFVPAFGFGRGLAFATGWFLAAGAFAFSSSRTSGSFSFGFSRSLSCCGFGTILG